MRIVAPGRLALLGDFVLLPVLACHGFVYAFTYKKTNNLYVPMLVHGISNGLTLIAMAMR